MDISMSFLPLPHLQWQKWHRVHLRSVLLTSTAGNSWSLGLYIPRNDLRLCSFMSTRRLLAVWPDYTHELTTWSSFMCQQRPNLASALKTKPRGISGHPSVSGARLLNLSSPWQVPLSRPSGQKGCRAQNLSYFLLCWKQTVTRSSWWIRGSVWAKTRADMHETKGLYHPWTAWKGTRRHGGCVGSGK